MTAFKEVPVANDDIPIRLIGSEWVAQKTLAASFELSDPRYTFEPGQAAVLSLSEKGKPGESRTLSLSSAPFEVPSVTFATRTASGSSFKEALAKARPGDEFFLSLPFGEFLLPRGEEAGYPVVCLAGGIGVTPFRSMIRERLQKKTAGEITPPLTLVTINRSPEETPFYEECRSWNGVGGVGWIPVETRSPKAGGASREDLVRRAMEEVFRTRGKEVRIYLAGPPAMVDSLSETLTAAFGFPRERLIVDLFFGYV